MLGWLLKQLFSITVGADNDVFDSCENYHMDVHMIQYSLPNFPHLHFLRLYCVPPTLTGAILEKNPHDAQLNVCVEDIPNIPITFNKMKYLVV